MELIDITTTALQGGLSERLSAQLGESPAATRRGVEQAVPLSIAGLAAHAATPASAEALLGTLRGGNYPHADAADLAETALNTDDTTRLARSGTGFLTQIFGDRLGGIADTLAGQAGVSKRSAVMLLGLSAPLVLHALGKEAGARNLDAGGLSLFLNEQGSKAKAALPTQLSSMIGVAAPAGTAAFKGRVREGYDDYRRRHPGAGGEARQRNVSERVEARPHDEPARGHWPLIAAGAVLLGMLALLIGKRADGPDATDQAGQTASKAAHEAKQAADTAAGAAERAAGEAEHAAGEAKHAAGEAVGEAERAAGKVAGAGEHAADEGTDEIERVAGGKPEAERTTREPERSTQEPERSTQEPERSTQEAGQVIALSGGAGGLEMFLAGDAHTPQRFTLEGVRFAPAAASIGDGNAMLDQVAEVLESHATTRVRIEGHADPSGDAEQNGALSQERAAAVKDYLVGKGLAAERIETVGTGSLRPVASNDTEQGRAENRRVDLIVLER